MNQVLDSILIALQAIWANKLRSFMTVLGNIVAVTSIVTVVTLIQGMNGMVADAIVNDIGADNFTVQRTPPVFSEDEAERNRSNPLITLDEAAAIRKFSPLIVSVAAQAGRNSTVSYRREEINNANIQGVTSSYSDFSTFSVERGRMMSPVEVERGQHLAGNLEADLPNHCRVPESGAKEIALPAVDGDRRSARLKRRLGDDVYDAARGVRSVERSTRAQHHLDPLHVLRTRRNERGNVDAKRRHEREAVVYKHHEVAGKQRVESARDHVGLNDPARGDVQTGNRAQLIDVRRGRSRGFLRRYGKDRCRRVERPLGFARRGDDDSVELRRAGRKQDVAERQARCGDEDRISRPHSESDARHHDAIDAGRRHRREAAVVAREVGCDHRSG